MTSKRPLTVGDVVGSDTDRLRELKDGEPLITPNGIVDENDVDLLTAASNTAAIQSGSPRGGVPFQDMRRGCVILYQNAGFWQAGTSTTGTDINPEKASPFYRTRVDANYSATGVLTGTVDADDVVSDGLGARYRVVSHNTVQKSLVLSLYEGTSATPVTLTVDSGGVPGSTITDAICSPAGSTTGYGDVSGEKAPFINAGGVVAGYFNCVGSRQNDIFGTATLRYPERPEFYETFSVPNNEFADGAVLEIVLSGVLKNTTPHNCTLYLVLNIGEDIFTTTSLGANNHRARMRFPVPLPAIAAETPFVATLKMTASRKDDRTEGNIAVLSFETDSATWGGSGAYRVGLQRGSDKVTSPTSFSGFDFEGDDDADPEVRSVGVWIAIGSDSGLGKGIALSGECYVTAHTIQARLFREGVA